MGGEKPEGAEINGHRKNRELVITTAEHAASYAQHNYTKQGTGARTLVVAETERALLLPRERERRGRAIGGALAADVEDAVVAHHVAVGAGDQDGVQLLALHAGRAGEPAGAGLRAGGEPAGGAAELLLRRRRRVQAGDEGLRHGDVLRRLDHAADVDAGGVGGG